MSLFNEIALDPQNSVVVEACAGSGKTWLLVSRILRLLLAGIPPAEILAITFTRRAAQEMQERLRDWLCDMALLPDGEVEKMLAERSLGAEHLSTARGLYEQFLVSNPMTITTFHGWFLEILKKAPLNAGLSGAALVEKTSPLIEEAWQSFAEELQADAASDNACALNELFRDYGLESTRKLLLNFISKRIEWWMYTRDSREPVSFACEKLQQELQVDLEDDPAAALLSDGIFIELIGEYRGYLARNPAKDQELAEVLSVPDFPALWSVFFTQKGELRKRSESGAQAKRLAGAESRFLELHYGLGERILEAQQQIVQQKILRSNISGFRAGAALLRHYQEIKERQSLVDFADVEWRVFLLMNDPEHAAYLQYKLDSRYRHILLDEFQDTNPLQWQVLHAWFSAAVEAGSNPKIFMVGDPKQSIYRFRRAEARLFQVAGDYLRDDFAAHKLSQNVSRRNSPVILDCVNRLFENEPAFLHFMQHQAHHADLPGRVEILPLPAAADNQAAKNSGIRNPLIEARFDEPDQRIMMEAAQFAQKVAELVGSYAVVDNGRERAAEYRDIMVLVKKRKDLAEYERALRESGIPYLGSSRGGLLDTLEAGDLISLVSFLTVPFADLHLARVLKSPIFAIADDELMQLAAIGEGSWWQRLQALDASASLVRARELLANWIQSADRLPVHDLLDRIYFEADLPARYGDSVPLAMKAGVQANLQSFLELALELDAGRYPSLQRFVDELSSMRELDINEAPDEGLVGDMSNAVRFYTVHGAKGLEAPIVFILGANPLQGPVQRGFDVVLDWPPQEQKPLHFSLYTVKDEQGEKRLRYFAAEEEHAAREDLNLLYVAMTRASQALFVSGVESRIADSWYNKLQAAAPQCGEYRSCAAEAEKPAGLQPIEDFSRFNSPVAFGQRKKSELSSEQRRGILLHSLLQHLAPPAAIVDHEWLGQKIGIDDEIEMSALLLEAQAIMQAPSLQRFFDPGQYLRAWNELPYAAADGQQKRIDRLVEFDDCLWVLDYKTGESADPSRHRAQLEEYRMAMRAIFRKKPVRAAVVFKNGDWVEI